MSTSGTVTSQGLIQDIIRDALYTINAIPAGTYEMLVDQGDTEIIAHARRVLMRMVRDWENEGLYLWKLARTTQALVASTASYALLYSVADVLAEDIFIRNSSGTDTQVRYITRREYSNLPDKTTTGRPTLLYIEKATANSVAVGSITQTYQGGLVLYPWPVPDSATDVLHFTKVSSIQDVTLDSQNADFPTKFQDALVFGLAYKLCFSHSVPSDRARMVRDEAEVTKARAKLNDKERGGFHWKISCGGI